MGLRIIKFMVVGGLGTLVNEGVFMLATHEMPIFFSLGLAIELSVLFNFILNDVWTFRDRRAKSFVRRLLKFHVSSFSGGVVQYIVTIGLLIVFLGFSNISEIISFIFFSHVEAQSTFLAVVNFIGILSGFIIRYLTSIRYVWVAHNG
jgi:putative flippase GtrA